VAQFFWLTVSISACIMVVNMLYTVNTDRRLDTFTDHLALNSYHTGQACYRLTPRTPLGPVVIPWNERLMVNKYRWTALIDVWWWLTGRYGRHSRQLCRVRSRRRRSLRGNRRWWPWSRQPSDHLTQTTGTRLITRTSSPRAARSERWLLPMSL